MRRQAAELAARILEADPEDIELADGKVGVVGAPAKALEIGQLAAMANPLRYAFGEETAEAALYTRRIYATQDVPLPDGTTPGLNATEYYSPKCGVFGFGMHAAVVEIDEATCDVRILQLRRRPRLRAHHQPDHRRGADVRRRGAGDRRGAVRAHGLRRERPAPERELHGLPDALRHGAAGAGAVPHRDAVAQQRARRQGRRRGRDDPRRRRDRQRHLRRDRRSRSTACRSRRCRSSSSSTSDSASASTPVGRSPTWSPCTPTGASSSTKVPSTPSDPSVAFMRAVEKAGTGEVVHGTTVATNALLEDDFSGLALRHHQGLPGAARDRAPERPRQLRQLVLLGQARPDRAAAPRAGGRRAARPHRGGGPRVRRGRGARGGALAPRAGDRLRRRLLPARVHEPGARAAHARRARRGASGLRGLPQLRRAERVPRVRARGHHARRRVRQAARGRLRGLDRGPARPVVLHHEEQRRRERRPRGGGEADHDDPLGAGRRHARARRSSPSRRGSTR